MKKIYSGTYIEISSYEKKNRVAVCENHSQTHYFSYSRNRWHHGFGILGSLTSPSKSQFMGFILKVIRNISTKNIDTGLQNIFIPHCWKQKEAEFIRKLKMLTSLAEYKFEIPKQHKPVHGPCKWPNRPTVTSKSGTLVMERTKE